MAKRTTETATTATAASSATSVIDSIIGAGMTETMKRDMLRDRVRMIFDAEIKRNPLFEDALLAVWLAGVTTGQEAKPVRKPRKARATAVRPLTPVAQASNGVQAGEQSE